MVGRLYPDSKRGQSFGEPGGEPEPPYACIVSLDQRSPYFKYGSTEVLYTAREVPAAVKDDALSYVN